MSFAGGDVFAGYTIERLLGAGGMGEVYLARHPRLPRSYALKIMSPILSSDSEFSERFKREAELAAELSDPRIVGVHDRGESDGRLWIAMDYIDGTDAAHLLRERYPAGLPVGDVIEIVSAIAAALDHAHQRGLLHRDVKPANVLVSRTDGGGHRILLADFGIARRSDDVSGLTATNMTLGTVAYSAPEQLTGQPIDGRADQYALAASTFHLLTGRKLFDDANLAVVINKQINAAAPRLEDVRPELAVFDPALSKALGKDPRTRFASCSDFAAALRPTPGSSTADVTQPALGPTVQPKTAAATPPGSPRTALRQTSRVRLALVPFLLGLLLLCAVVFAVMQGGKTLPPTYVSTSSEWHPYVDAGAQFAAQMFSYEHGNEAAAVQATVAGATGALREMLTKDGNVDKLTKLFRDTNASSVATVHSAALESFEREKATVLVALSVQVGDLPSQKYRLQIVVVREDGVLKVADLKYPDGGN